MGYGYRRRRRSFRRRLQTDLSMPSPQRSRPRPVFHAVEVVDIQDLSARVRRIRLVGDAIKGMEWTAGQKVKLKGTDFLRSYTISELNPQHGWMDIIFFLHGKGLASQWAANTGRGDEILFTGPTKSVVGPEKVPEWALFLGDESTIGLADAVLGALPDDVQIVGAIELDMEDAQAVEACGLPLMAAIREGAHGDVLLRWLQNHALPDGQGMIWVSGEAITVRALRDALAEGPTRDDVEFVMKAYWSCRGHAHRKALGV